MKGAILYATKYGTTAQYAEWIVGKHQTDEPATTKRQRLTCQFPSAGHDV
ncbi:flavodoxin domain-containing protein [Pseudohalocynthiibacter sp. F2068]|nr:flavodoxin domain-containing protein [Pseudohalocynthiibacter sp. F2068]MCK0103253.1 flavodoxin domain-containing protein [Pseudohalocynthiibacter sp. F2068]